MRQRQRKHNHLVPASTASSQMPLAQRPLQATYTNHQMSPKTPQSPHPSCSNSSVSVGLVAPLCQVSLSPRHLYNTPSCPPGCKAPVRACVHHTGAPYQTPAPSQAPLLQAGVLLALLGSSPALVPLSCKPCKLALGKGGAF